jgi:hypothetical protein
MEEKVIKLLLSKLQRPIHISFISEYILKKSEEETRQILNHLVENNMVVESYMGVDYYVVK